MELGDALAWLDRHQNLERMLADARSATPDLGRMRRLVDIMGHPEAACPVIHVTGTNGKTSTARIVTQLLMARGLSVGTFTSPHLERINERICANGEPIADDALAEVLSDIAALEGMVGERLTWFEALTAAAFRFFADRPVDLAVIEVGLGGRWDATNVVNGAVSVVTNVGLDHVEFLGPTRADIAAEKAGIIRSSAPLVLGEPDPELVAIFEAEDPERVLLVGRDYACERNDVAVGGRSIDLRTPLARYEGVWLDLHGRHQADNFAAAVTAVEAFFDAPTPERLVRDAAGSVRSPGRMEIVGRRPLVILDGAKNVEGARSAAAAISEEFGDRLGRILVVGMLGGKDPAEMLEALGAAGARLLIACPPPSPRAQDPAVLAAAAAALGVEARVAASVPEALDAALAAASPDDLVLVTGSLYVVGAARATFAGQLR
ncbi:bifunctional folylpolyglutamate synthase/dihydrofolate synthase [Acidiferrimicrobium sp. IK]|uniref:bifunctional folylpolyglutamate synthase/dihydrofolate synthase n=1 Tax=Acidiferrimicrobium sp. IK TaxID=2871700 RepID=UPI0021CB9134|nr:folylpolyglutamate synthase/dihydrofolate synthase family protein [Acidiferrimicrobium sp. IK]MCU4185505.1 bifunctional folylpolyglutamate synthase/dihydrofolate synthase [Acidiferrimicrobium sp. IK]